MAYLPYNSAISIRNQFGVPEISTCKTRALQILNSDRCSVDRVLPLNLPVNTSDIVLAGQSRGQIPLNWRSIPIQVSDNITPLSMSQQDLDDPIARLAMKPLTMSLPEIRVTMRSDEFSNTLKIATDIYHQSPQLQKVGQEIGLPLVNEIYVPTKRTVGDIQKAYQAGDPVVVSTVTSLAQNSDKLWQKAASNPHLRGAVRAYSHGNIFGGQMHLVKCITGFEKTKEKAVKRAIVGDNPMQTVNNVARLAGTMITGNPSFVAPICGNVITHMAQDD